MFDNTQIDRDDVGIAVGTAIGIGFASALTSGGPWPRLVGGGTALLSVVVVLALSSLE
jgi:hypothetical protein